jgi:hypothetical protein
MGPQRNADGNSAQMHDVLVGQVKCMPVRIQCLHYLFDDDDAQAGMKASVDASEQRLKVRYQLHYGTSVKECKKQLQGVGIPVSSLPFHDDGSFDLKYHQDWMQKQKERESKQEVAPKSLALPALPAAAAAAAAAALNVPSTPPPSVAQQQIMAALQQASTQQGFPLNQMQLPTGLFSSALGMSLPFASQDVISSMLARSPMSFPQNLSVQQQQPPPPPPPTPQQQSQQPMPYAAARSDDVPANPDEGVVPGQLDVLLGKSSVVMSHSGNVRYGHILDQHYPSYEVADKMEKTCIAELCLAQVSHYGGRFLKKQGDGWVEISQLEARNKVVRTRRVCCIFLSVVKILSFDF